MCSLGETEAQHSSEISHPQAPPATRLCFLGKTTVLSATERLARVRGQVTARINGQEKGNRLPAWGGELGTAGMRKVLGNAGVNEAERVKRRHHCQHRARTAFSRDGKPGDGQGMGSALPCSLLPVLIPEDWNPYGCTVTLWLGKSILLPQIPPCPQEPPHWGGSWDKPEPWEDINCAWGGVEIPPTAPASRNPFWGAGR